MGTEAMPQVEPGSGEAVRRRIFLKKERESSPDSKDMEMNQNGKKEMLSAENVFQDSSGCL